MSYLLNEVYLHTLSERECQPVNDKTNFMISTFLCIGLVVSYLPQVYRIIANKTSEGFSPWFLLLGLVSSTSSFLNIILLQWNSILCCSSISSGDCLEGLMGIVQIGLQWMMFCVIFVLYLLYFPENKKRIIPTSLHAHKTPLTAEWNLSLMVAITALCHMCISFVISVLLLIRVGGPEHTATNYWAGFLGVLSMVLASLQYLPQIWKTFHSKRVGALSIPMMMLQTPGSALFVYSLIVRPGTNWTAWITFLVTGLLQGTLLTMCIVWHFRNKRLGLSDLDGIPNRLDENTPLLQ